MYTVSLWDPQERTAVPLTNGLAAVSIAPEQLADFVGAARAEGYRPNVAQNCLASASQADIDEAVVRLEEFLPDGTAVTGWRLVRIDDDGALLKFFVNDVVTSARGLVPTRTRD